MAGHPGNRNAAGHHHYPAHRASKGHSTHHAATHHVTHSQTPTVHVPLPKLTPTLAMPVVAPHTPKPRVGAKSHTPTPQQAMRKQRTAVYTERHKPKFGHATTKLGKGASGIHH